VGFAVLLEEAELAVRLGEGALEVGLVALETGEGVGAVVFSDEDGGEDLGAGERFFSVTVGVEAAEDFGLGVVEAAESPGELGDLLDEDGFGGGEGVEGVVHFVAVDVVGVLVLGGEDGGAAHAVAAGVLG
jgi:hypothetical protein